MRLGAVGLEGVEIECSGVTAVQRAPGGVTGILTRLPAVARAASDPRK